jgi:hypothetical protein
MAPHNRKTRAEMKMAKMLKVAWKAWMGWDADSYV